MRAERLLRQGRVRVKEMQMKKTIPVVEVVERVMRKEKQRSRTVKVNFCWSRP